MGSKSSGGLDGVLVARVPVIVAVVAAVVAVAVISVIKDSRVGGVFQAQKVLGQAVRR